MSTQNMTAEMLENTKEAQLLDPIDAVIAVETAEALIQERRHESKLPAKHDRDKRKLEPIYPEWPTSTPGPQATLPQPGMQSVPVRTDQVIYECYDQERGIPCMPTTASPPIRPHPLANQVKAGQQVYDAQGTRVGKILVCWPGYLLVERGLILRRSYYVPLSLIQRVEEQRVWLAVKEATLDEQGYANPPSELYHVPRQSGATAFPDISGVGKYPPTPAETGFYHYGPRGPGINTDAGGSYAPHEIDPYRWSVDRPADLHSTEKLVQSRTL